MQPKGSRKGATARSLDSGGTAGGPAPSREPDLASVEEAIRRSRESLLSLQADDGHWCGELEADSVLESEYIMLLRFLGREDGERARKAAERIRRLEHPDGGWAIFPGGEPEVSATVKAYFALKLLGDDPDAPHMRRARRRALERGGVEATNTYTKIYLAMFGQYPWSKCPAIPPEIMLLPRWFFVNVNEMSSWSRGIFVPLSVVWAYRPVRTVPDRARIDELYVPGEGARAADEDDPAERYWRAFFETVDRGLKALERSRALRPLRAPALRFAERWIRDRLEESDGLGAIFPAILNTILAFHLLGYREDHPVLERQFAALEKLLIEEDDHLRIQPALSPVWDTAQTMSALVASGLRRDHPALTEGAEWLLEREVRRSGDWVYNNPEVEPGGWYFEYANEFYPDCDDTAEVLLALDRVEPTDPELEEGIGAARERGMRWLLSMQNEDGGWAAFDRGCDKEFLAHVPFADHNAMLDPSCEDITGRVLELLAGEGFDRSHPAVVGGVRFLREAQCEDGSWYGRWGCNYIYGTWLALRGLAAVGEDMSRDRYRRAVRWLESCQNPDGGWGETLASYSDPARKGEGHSTASQTAWALMGLLAAGCRDSGSVRRGLDYLLRTQREDGSWEDEYWTGTGFPEVFYLRYHLYDDYFPLLALAAYLDARRARRDPPTPFGAGSGLLKTG